MMSFTFKALKLSPWYTNQARILLKVKSDDALVERLKNLGFKTEKKIFVDVCPNGDLIYFQCGD